MVVQRLPMIEKVELSDPSLTYRRFILSNNKKSV
jgi:hypothetical protein